MTRLVLAATVVVVGLASAVLPTAAASGQGYDISYPQCGKRLPGSASFVILGVNGGKPFRANPCLGAEYRWARRVGADVAYYVNTANPGPADPHWGKPGPLPCNGTATDRGCAYNFGFAAAGDAYNYAAKVTRATVVHRFWLDVETANKWSADRVVNVFVLQGMVDYLTPRSRVITGIYSTPRSWSRITGGAQAPTIPNWVAAAANRTEAAAMCAASPTLTGGPVLLVQYPQGGLDNNYWCGRQAA